MASRESDQRTIPVPSLPSLTRLYRIAVRKWSERALRYRNWRNRKIASASFRKSVMRLPGLRAIANKKAAALFRMTAGFVFSQVLSACVRLGVFELLKTGVRSTEELAQSGKIAPEKMQLLLEQATRLELVTQVGPDLWMLDDAGAVVAADQGITEMILHHEMLYRDLDPLEDLPRHPDKETNLKAFWAYARGNKTLDLDNGTAQKYSTLMQNSQSMLADCILDAHDFDTYRAILDLGGGDGSFLAACVEQYPNLNLHLFDLPAVTELARENLSAKGLINKTEIHSGDFANSPLPNIADCVILVRILCDHDNERVRQILKNLHSSLRPGTKIVIAEAMAGNSEGARLAAVYFSFYFLAMGSGRCRSDAEIKSLLTEAGFRRPNTVKTYNPLLATLVLAER